MKKNSFLLFVVFMIGQTMFAQSSNEIREYINKYKFIALEHEKTYGIPAAISLAQGILESAAGTSGLAKTSNNHFGIKRGTGWTGSLVYFWDDEPQKSAFRRYNSVKESYEDHARILKNKRYRELFDKSIFDYRGWAHGLQNAGYATSPTYAKTLIGYIDSYQLYSINGGVKLRPGIVKVIKKTVTIDELVKDTIISMNEESLSEEEENVASIVQRIGFVVEINDVPCTLIYPGETLSSVAIRYNIPKQKILKYNESTDEQDFKEGDIVFVSKKRKRYYGARDYYHVRKDESLYQVSQYFGIRLSNLCKMNDLSLFSSLSEGQKIRLK